MDGDRAFARFFAYMNFFVFAMLTLVLSDNVVGLLVGWGLVGLASYFLIGFWFERPSAVAAARKAFVMNVVGDVGIMFAIFVIVAKRRLDRLRATSSPRVGAAFTPHELFLICLGLFIGCAAKSAQVPLHTWLPDAMEGPTPVSALIHAATMVTAGVYLIARFAPLWIASADARELVGVIGALTAIAGADPGLRAVGHQADPGLLDDVADRLHDHGRRGRRVRRRRVPLSDPRVLQGAALPGRGDRDPRPGQRAGRAPDGRPAHALPFAFVAMLVGVLAICGVPGLQRFLQQGRRRLRRAAPRVIRGCTRSASSPRGSPRTTCSGCCSSRSSARIAATSIRRIWGFAIPSWPGRGRLRPPRRRRRAAPSRAVVADDGTGRRS